MPSDEQMRHIVKNTYPGPFWAEKVDRMSNHQVAAIYQRLLNSGKLKNR